MQQVICHRNTHPGNIFYSEGRAMFVDWDSAGWDDPMRPPARFFVLAFTPLADVADGLATYLGRPATESEVPHLYRIMLATEIEC